MAPDTSAATETPEANPGTDLGTAASSIADLLARDSGTPGATPAREAETGDAEDAMPIDAEDAAPDTEDAARSAGEADASDPTALVAVELEGRTERLPLSELTRGYLRQADYTRKTQALAEDRRAFDGEAAAVRQERLQYAELLPALAFQFQQQQGPEPDWARLKAEDPVGYVMQREEWRDGQARMEAARAEYERIRVAEAVAAEGELHGKLRQEGDLLVQAMPAWRDKDRRNADRGKVRDYGRKLGWSEAELSSVTDHRAVVVLYKAMKYDEAMQKRLQPEPPRIGLPAARPGSQPLPRHTGELMRAKHRLAKSNSLRDARAVIEKLL
jgi:hypothetical protein